LEIIICVGKTLPSAEIFKITLMNAGRSSLLLQKPSASAIQARCSKCLMYQKVFSPIWGGGVCGVGGGVGVGRKHTVIRIHVSIFFLA
jgi:hypothetical protein